MIVEGIITTEDLDGQMHVTPIGPHVDREHRRWELKPFKTSATFTNLYRTNRGVFHIIDDGLLLVQSVLGLCNTEQSKPASEFRQGVGWILSQSCRVYPLSITEWDIREERACAKCRAGESIDLKPFWGWNRAANSLLELSVVWSRRHLVSPSELSIEFARHRMIIHKTAGDREFAALELLEQAMGKFASSSSTS